jgi:hypothetical protein
LRNEKLHMLCLKGAELHEIDARNTSLEHVNFVDSKWEHIYLSNVHVNMIQMGGTLFENIIRPDASQSQLNEEPGTDGWINVEPVRFRKSDLSKAVFEDCELVDVELRNCNIDGLKINGIRIKEVLEQFRANLKEPALIAKFRKLRKETLRFAEGVPTELLDRVPEGFNNSIRWNLGHILVAWDHAIFPKLNQNWRIPEHYHYLFPNGSSPKTWNTSPPDFQEIIKYLKAQTDEIAEVCIGRLDDPLPEPFLRIKSIRGMYNFMLREETHHLNFMKKLI